jgi:hypothetical protein
MKRDGRVIHAPVVVSAAGIYNTVSATPTDVFVWLLQCAGEANGGAVDVAVSCLLVVYRWLLLKYGNRNNSCALRIT